MKPSGIELADRVRRPQWTGSQRARKHVPNRPNSFPSSSSGLAVADVLGPDPAAPFSSGPEGRLNLSCSQLYFTLSALHCPTARGGRTQQEAQRPASARRIGKTKPDSFQGKASGRRSARATCSRSYSLVI